MEWRVVVMGTRSFDLSSDSHVRILVVISLLLPTMFMLLSVGFYDGLLLEVSLVRCRLIIYATSTVFSLIRADGGDYSSELIVLDKMRFLLQDCALGLFI